MSDFTWVQRGYAQDPSADDYDGTLIYIPGVKGDVHHIEGQGRFHWNAHYRTKKAGRSAGQAYEHFYEVPDLDTLVYQPEFGINYRVWTTKNGNRVLDGRHPTRWMMALYTADREKLAEWEGQWSLREHSHTEKHSLGIEIQPDSGIYQCLWVLNLDNRVSYATKSPDPSLPYDTTEHRWFEIDSASAHLKDHLRAMNGM
ncbi:hypothetical protein R1T08_14695 [Streptomyces sp. SBC-4]|nr:hypothetical protein [Streptomyces sp. SBC-4]MDV5145426.1 hypothetical protein [Streptomyces sp. SBC-4]